MNRYFDYNATSPLDEQVIQAMVDDIRTFGNPSSNHSFGWKAKSKVDEAKGHIAKLIHADPNQIVVTSGGSEANNLAIKGWLHQFQSQPGHLITSCIEHPSILEIFHYYECLYGFDVTYLPVDRNGRINPEDLRKSLRADTQLISIMLANNEIGTIQPIQQMTEIAKQHGIYFHTDAVQAIGKINVNVHELGVDSLSFSGHKFYGPKGVGGLYIKDSSEFEPIIHGGGQENGLRSGTENLLSLIGLGKACEIAHRELIEHKEDIAHLKKLLITTLLDQIPNCSINGTYNYYDSLPNTVNICLHDIRAETLAAQLNELFQIAISVGSACSSNHQTKLSHVLASIGLDEDEIKSSIRISLGKHNREEDIYFLVDSIKMLVTNLRRLLPSMIGGK